MIVNDYLVRNNRGKEEKYVKGAISFQDAVDSSSGEQSVWAGQGIGVHFFDGLSSGKRYAAHLIKKIYIVSTGESCSYEVRARRSDIDSAKDFMERFPDEDFNPIEEKILDDPRDRMCGFNGDERNLYFIITHPTGKETFWVWKQKKNIKNFKKIKRIRLSHAGEYYIWVMGRDEKDAMYEARELIKLEEEN